MPIDIIGMISTQESSEIIPPSGPPIDPEFTDRISRAHEDADFDQVLVGYYSKAPDGWMVANRAAGATERLKFLLAHRTGFVAPTLAARMAATFDQLTGGGRLALHIITGADEADQRRDGDFVDHDARYRRTGEYLSILRRLWSSQEPFTYEGEFYRFEGAMCPVLPVTPGGIPLSFAGVSDAAIAQSAKYADIHHLQAEPLAGMRERKDAIDALAAAEGRTLTYKLAVRIIIAPTEEAAWAKADDIAEKAQALRDRFFLNKNAATTSNTSVGSQRINAVAATGDRHDTRLWTKIAAITGAAGNSTTLVGTPEQVVEALLEYIDMGFTGVLIRGFYPLDDAIEFGNELIPMLRSEVARRDAATSIERSLASS